MNKTSSAVCQKTTKAQIARALFAMCATDGFIRIGNIDFNGVSSVEREDGSGKRFNVTGYNLCGQMQTVYCETAD